MKLSEDDKDLLRDLMRSDAWKSLNKLCEMLLEKQAQVVLTCDVDKDLALVRARYDGAKSLVAGLDAAKRQFIKEERD